MTPRDLIKGALRLIGVIASGEEPSASELQDAKQSWNLMIGSWSTENLALFRLSREVFELIPGQAAYSVGIGGEFDTTKPMSIVGAASGDLRKVPRYETPEPTEEIPDPEPVLVGYDLFVDLEIPIEVINYQRWMGQTLKVTTSKFPNEIYKEETSPLETVHLYPVPSEAIGLVLYARKALSEVDDENVQLELPEGYEEAIKYNLALRLAPEFGKEPSPYVVSTANKSLGNIKRKNSRVIIAKSDAFGLSSNKRAFNILSGDSK